LQQGTVPESTRSPPPRDDERLAEARRRVAAIKGFYIHLIVFVAVIVSLALLNAASGDPWWVQWVFLGWGIGVLAHALAVFGRGSKLVSEWEKRKIKELLEEK
jgi:fatty acid desaturase